MGANLQETTRQKAYNQHSYRHDKDGYGQTLIGIDRASGTFVISGVTAPDSRSTQQRTTLPFLLLSFSPFSSSSSGIESERERDRKNLESFDFPDLGRLSRRSSSRFRFLQQRERVIFFGLFSRVCLASIRRR